MSVRALFALALACAVVVTGISIGIPLLIKWIIDDAIRGDQRERLVPYLAAIVALALLALWYFVW